MKKLYRVVLLLGALIFLTTYNPTGFNNFPKQKYPFFKIKNIKVVNNNIINEEEILEKLNHIYDKNIIVIKRNDLEMPLESMNFLEKIEVKKEYPNTVVIKIYETKPIAILFKKDDKYILDSLSQLVPFNKNMFINDFPSVFGEEAELYFINFVGQLEDNSFPKQKIKNYYYFKIGRWDIQLINNQIIKFPEKKITEAIKQSIELLNDKNFINYDVIDLRIRGKIVVE